MGIKTVLYLRYNRFNGLECKTEMQNSQLEHRQPMEQTKGLFSKCDSGVTRCQSQLQCHFWRINLMFEAYCLAAVNQLHLIHEAMNDCKNLKIH